MKIWGGGFPVKGLGAVAARGQWVTGKVDSGWILEVMLRVTHGLTTKVHSA